MSSRSTPAHGGTLKRCRLPSSSDPPVPGHDWYAKSLGGGDDETVGGVVDGSRQRFKVPPCAGVERDDIERCVGVQEGGAHNLVPAAGNGPLTSLAADRYPQRGWSAPTRQCHRC